MELSGQCIFILGLMRYDNVVESTNYTIARHLARQNDVFYIDNPYTYKDYFKLRNTAAFNRRKPYFPPTANGVIDTDIPRLKIVITPPTASINWLPEGAVYRLALQVNERMIYQRIQQIKQAFAVKSFIYINSFNFYYPNLGRMLAPSLMVYHCVDPLVHPYEIKHGRASEAQIVKQSDLVICTSNHLVKKWQGRNANTFFVPNAADIIHSGRALSPELEIHELLATIPRPIVGYFGAIERRLDYDLLHELILRHPDKSFVFAGPVSEEYIPPWFFEIPNIYLVGSIPYELMPQLLKGFTVAVIPFKTDEVSAGIFPLKLFEYLGAGLPVVATNFNPDLADFTADTVSYCGDATEFTTALDKAITDRDSPSLKAARLFIAAKNTWERRTAEFGALIGTHLLLKRQSLKNA